MKSDRPHQLTKKIVFWRVLTPDGAWSISHFSTVGASMKWLLADVPRPGLVVVERPGRAFAAPGSRSPSSAVKKLFSQAVARVRDVVVVRVVDPELLDGAVREPRPNDRLVALGQPVEERALVDLALVEADEDDVDRNLLAQARAARPPAAGSRRWLRPPLRRQRRLPVRRRPERGRVESASSPLSPNLSRLPGRQRCDRKRPSACRQFARMQGIPARRRSVASFSPGSRLAAWRLPHPTACTSPRATRRTSSSRTSRSRC